MGHVQKRMGARLKAWKKGMAGEAMEDGGAAGKLSLTEANIDQ